MARKIFIALFFVLTVLPALQTFTGLVPNLTVDENRRLAPPPSAATPIDKIPRVADRWYSDHFGLRSALIRMKTQIDYSVFGLSDRVLIGKDGQLFYRGSVNEEEPAVDALLFKSGDAAARGFRDFAKALKAAGMGCIVTVNMMSDRFYPELLPSDAVRRPSSPRIDALVAKLRDVPEMDFIDSASILKATKRERRIFHKTDFHWNDPAAFPVAEAVVDRISAAEGRVSSAWKHPLVIDRQRLSGGIAMFMPLFFPPSENGLFVKPTWDWPPGFRDTPSQGPFEDASRADPNPNLLPPTVFVGDSFFDGMVRSGLQAYFVKTGRLRWSPNLKVSDIAASLPPDTRWVVIELIEVNRAAISAFADADDVAKAVAIVEKLGESRQTAR